MSLRNLPSEILYKVLDCLQLSTRDLRNLRLTCRRFKDICGSRLFHRLVLDLDIDKDDKLITDPDVPNTPASDSVDAGINTAHGQGLENTQSKDQSTWWFAYDVNHYGQHVRDLVIKGWGAKTCSRTRMLQDSGLGLVLSKLPQLASISITLTKPFLVKPEWQNFLQSLCPSQMAHSSADTEPLKRTWSLDVKLRGNIREYTDDVYWTNLKILQNINSLAVETGSIYNISQINGTLVDRGTAMMKGLQGLIMRSPQLAYFELHLGYGNTASMDLALNAIPQEFALPITKLKLENTFLPVQEQNVVKLKKLKEVDIREPWGDPSHTHNSKISKCFWHALQKQNTHLLKFTTNTVCQGLIDYIRHASTIRNLTTIDLRSVSCTTKGEMNALAVKFWDAVLEHKDTLRDLYLDPTYYGSWCWTPGSPAEQVIPHMQGLEKLSIVPADDAERQSGRGRGKDYVDEFITSMILTNLPRLHRVNLNTASSNDERDAECGTNVVMAQSHMLVQYRTRLDQFCYMSDTTEARNVSFSVVSKTRDYGRDDPDDVWKPQKGSDGSWRFRRIMRNEDT